LPRIRHDQLVVMSSLNEVRNVKANKRADVIVTVAEKTRITQAARASGISTGEYMRRAAAAYGPP